MIVTASDAQAMEAVKTLLRFIGEDPEREGLLKTPLRVARALRELTDGYMTEESELFESVFTDKCDELVLLKNIEFRSLCEHHLLPFTGRAHIGYIPNGKVLGISKLARLLDIYAHRLQMQERIGQQVTNSLTKYLNIKGSGCIIQAVHLCMRCRGVEKQNSEMVTSSLTGVFRENPQARMEFLSLVGLEAL